MATVVGTRKADSLFLMPKKLEISYMSLDLCYEKHPQRPANGPNSSGNWIFETGIERFEC